MRTKKKHASFSSLLVAAATVLALFSGVFIPAGAADKEPVDVTANTSNELPPLFSPDEDMFELENLYTEDGNGCLHNRTDDGKFDYYYLKGDYQTAYMSFPFEVDSDGTYELCVALMAIRSSVPRSAELSINGERRYYVERDYRDVSEGDLHAEYVSGITAYLRKGTNVLTVYPGASPNRVLFNRNFRSLVTSTVFCNAGYVTDEEKGEVLELTVAEDLEPFRFAFSYSKYMKLLGLDPETETCDEYMYAVLAIKADEMLVNGNVNFFYFTAGSDVLDFGKMADDSFENDGKWQYLLFDMEEDSGWYADLKGGTFFIGSGGSEPGTKVRIAEFVLFKTYAEAMKYAGFTTGEETATDTDAVTVTETATEQVTQTESTVPMQDSATSGDTAVQTGAETGKSGGCSSAVGGGILLCVLPAAWILQRRRREGKR